MMKLNGIKEDRSHIDSYSNFYSGDSLDQVMKFTSTLERPLILEITQGSTYNVPSMNVTNWPNIANQDYDGVVIYNTRRSFNAIDRGSNILGNHLTTAHLAYDFDEIIAKIQSTASMVSTEVDVIPKSPVPLATFNAQAWEPYNLVVVSNPKQAMRSAVAGAVHITFLDLLLQSDDFFNRLKSKLDPNKPIVVVSNELYGDSRSKIVDIGKILSERLETEISVSEYGIYLSKTVTIDDNKIDLPFRNHFNLIDPLSFISKLNVNEHVDVVCNVGSCMEQLPVFMINQGLNIQQFFDFEMGFTLKEELVLQKFKKDANYVFVTPNLLDFVLSYKLASFLSENGYVIEGFISGSSEYYSNTFLYDDKYIVESKQIKPVLKVFEVYESLWPKQPLEAQYTGFITILMLLVACTLLVKPYALKGGLMATVIVLMLFVDRFFLFPIEAYRTLYFNQDQIVLLLAAFNLFANGKKGILGSLLILALGLNIEISSPLMQLNNVGFVVLTMAVVSAALALIKLFIRLYYKQPYDRKKIGSKYINTIDFVRPNNKGQLLNLDSRIMPVIGRKFILRSNHLGHVESELAGVHKSYVCNWKELSETFSLAKEEALAAGIEKGDIQFWLQTYIQGDQSGVISSHSSKGEEYVAFSIGKGESVTDGTQSYTYFINRFGSGFCDLSNIVLKKLKKIEGRSIYPVIVEFVLKGSQIYVTQVRPQQLEREHDSKICQRIRNASRKQFSLYENNSTYTPLGRSTIHRLYGGHVLATATGTYIEKRRVKTKYQLSTINRVWQELLDKSARLELVSKTITPKELSQTFSQSLQDILFDSKEMDFPLSDEEIGVYREIQARLIMKDHTLLNDLDVGSEIITYKNEEAKHCDYKALRRAELVHMLFAYCVQCISYILRERCDYTQAHFNLSAEAIEQGVPPFETSNSVSDSSSFKEREIVSGDFNGPILSLEAFLNLSDDDKSNFIVESQTIPLAVMMECMKAKAIISHSGNELSHISLTAKRLNVPLKIIDVVV